MRGRCDGRERGERMERGEREERKEREEQRAAEGGIFTTRKEDCLRKQLSD
jgi:hypothetical protein